MNKCKGLANYPSFYFLRERPTDDFPAKSTGIILKICRVLISKLVLQAKLRVFLLGCSPLTGYFKATLHTYSGPWPLCSSLTNLVCPIIALINQVQRVSLAIFIANYLVEHVKIPDYSALKSPGTPPLAPNLWGYIIHIRKYIRGSFDRLKSCRNRGGSNVDFLMITSVPYSTPRDGNQRAFSSIPSLCNMTALQLCPLPSRHSQRVFCVKYYVLYTLIEPARNRQNIAHLTTPTLEKTEQKKAELHLLA